MLMLKIIFLKKNYYDIFLSKKHFEKQLLPHSQTPQISCIMWLKLKKPLCCNLSQFYILMYQVSVSIYVM
jgi:hypothetical protein